MPDVGRPFAGQQHLVHGHFPTGNGIQKAQQSFLAA